MGLKAPDFAPADNPASDRDANCLLTRTLTFFYLPVFNFYLLLFPRWLSFDWSMEAIPLVSHPLDPRNALSLAFYACLLMLTRIVARHLQSTSSEWCYSKFDKTAICLPCAACQPTKSSHHKKSASLSRAANNNNNNNVHSHVHSHVQSQCSCGVTLLSPYATALHSHNSSWDADETSSCSSSASSSITSSTSSSSSSTSSSSSRNSVTSSHSHVERLGMALTLLVLPFIPAANLFFYVGFVVAERIMYIPSFGYCLLIAIGMEGLMKRKTGRFITLIALSILSILLVSFAARTFVRNIDWLTEEKLYASGIPINPPKGRPKLQPLSSSFSSSSTLIYYRHLL